MNHPVDMFVRTKTFPRKNGPAQTYVYLVESRRHPKTKKVSQATLASLGRLEEVQGKLPALMGHLSRWCEKRTTLLVARDTLKAEAAHSLGPRLIYERLWEELQVKSFIAQYAQGTAYEFPLERVIFTMVLNRLTDPRSKLSATSWAPTVYGLPAMEVQHLYRALDFLIAHKDKLERDLFNQIRTLFSLEVDLVLWDTTTISTYGDGAHAPELVRFGHPKNKRTDLRQITVGVLMSKEGLPLGHEVFPGHMNDMQSFKHLLAKVQERFTLRQVVVVSDRGMISKANLALLEEKHMRYILGLRLRTLKRDLEEALLSKAELTPIAEQPGRAWKEYPQGNGTRIVMIWSEARASDDRARREDILRELQQGVKGGNVKETTVHPAKRRYLARQDDGTITINQDAVALEERRDGFWGLATNHPDLSAPDLIRFYQGLQEVEAGFRVLKHELEAGPMYHWVERRVRAHAMVCFLALVLELTFARRLEQHQAALSRLKVEEDLRQLQAVTLQVDGQRYVLRTELQGDAHQAFAALQMRPPPRFLEEPTGKGNPVVGRILNL